MTVAVSVGYSYWCSRTSRTHLARSWGSIFFGMLSILSDSHSSGIKPGPTQTPHWIHLEQPLSFAGLYSWGRPKGDETADWLLTATTLTRLSTGPFAELHDRAPLVLPDQAQADWLDPGTEGAQALVDAMVDASTSLTEQLAFHPVRPLRGDGPELIEPA